MLVLKTRIEKLNVLLVVNSLLTRNNNNFWDFPLGQISQTLFWGAEGLGVGCVYNNAYCFLLRMANLLIFIHNGGIHEKALYSPNFKMVLIFLQCSIE